MKRKQFTFYRSYYEALKTLPLEEQAKTCMGIAGYALDEEEPELDGNSRVIFELIRPTLDSSRKRAEKYMAQEEKKDAETNVGQLLDNCPDNCTDNCTNNCRTIVCHEGEGEKEVESEVESEIEIEKETEIEIESDSSNARTRASVCEERFNRFWAEYPRKVGKQAALKAWKKIRPSEELTQTIIDAVKAQKSWPQWKEENGRFIPNPATWLNQGRWSDERTDTSGDAGRTESSFAQRAREKWGDLPL